MEQWHTQDFGENDKLNQTYIEWTDRVNETQVQTVSANDSGQRIMGNEVFIYIYKYTHMYVYI